MSYFGIEASNTSSWIEWARELGWSSRVDPYVRWREQLTGAWQFIGLGPPGAIQLAPPASHPGRVLVPGYHSFIRGLDAASGQGAGVGLYAPAEGAEPQPEHPPIALYFRSYSSLSSSKVHSANRSPPLLPL